MMTKRVILIALFVLATLTVGGCALFHHGPRHCKSDCQMSAGQTPCAQKDCQKALENKPCCNKMKDAGTPAQ